MAKAADMLDEERDTRREQTLGTLLGQERTGALLGRMVERNRLPHALLFHGPGCLGKLSMAYALIRRVECREGGEELDCGCRVCQKLRRGSWYDLTEIRPETRGQRMIRVDTIRETEDFLARMPMEGRRRFLIVQDADRMNLESANAFLKTLEEPPRHLQIVLITDRFSALLPTIRSRCTAIRFSPVERTALAAWLRELGGGDPALSETLATLSGGCPGLALRMLNSDVLDRRGAVLEALARFNAEGFRVLFKTAYEMNRATEEELSASLGYLMSWQRDLLVARAAPEADEELLMNADLRERIREESGRYSVRALVETLERIVAGYAWSGRLVNTQLALENLLLQVGAAGRRR